METFISAGIFSTGFTLVIGYFYRRATASAIIRGIDDIRAENEQIRKSPEYREWRLTVLKRDGYKCVWWDSYNSAQCAETQNLEVDHIYPFGFFPELRFDINNGRTLCHYHHTQTITYGTGSKQFYEQLKSRI